MRTVYHIYPQDLYRAAALNAYIARGLGMDEAVRAAIKAADLMEEKTNNSEDLVID